jgi:hypothetical protein
MEMNGNEGKQDDSVPEAGKEVVIACGGQPAAEPMPGKAPRREFGSMKGVYDVPDAFFFDPLPEDELKRWEAPANEVPLR